jgi:hypothetical protein
MTLNLKRRGWRTKSTSRTRRSIFHLVQKTEKWRQILDHHSEADALETASRCANLKLRV